MVSAPVMGKEKESPIGEDSEVAVVCRPPSLYWSTGQLVVDASVERVSS